MTTTSDDVMRSSSSWPDDLPRDFVYEPHKLDLDEQWWLTKQPWLLTKGYILRPRFQPGWKPSWRIGEDYESHEDARGLVRGTVCDAIRESDGCPVMLKRTKWDLDNEETKIGKLFSTPLFRDERNHCVPFYAVLEPPSEESSPSVALIIVMPLLRPFYKPRFDTFGETVDFFQQVFEGVQFLHEQHIAHRDLTYSNIMMDAAPMYPNSWHPSNIDKSVDYTGPAKHYTRTQCPPRYIIIDFGISITSVHGDLADVHVGGDNSVPEFQDSSVLEADPYPTDIYFVGNMIRRAFIHGHIRSLPACRGFEFIQPLIDDMVQDDPQKRPTINEVVDRFQTICAGLPTSKLRSRVVYTDETRHQKLILTAVHWARRLKYTLLKTPAIPTAAKIVSSTVDKAPSTT